MVLADEINRATPKAQSALLEAMEEQQVTVEGHTYPLPQPFFVIATQNPSHQSSNAEETCTCLTACCTNSNFSAGNCASKVAINLCRLVPLNNSRSAL
jgi:hypothetical protein